MTFQSVPKQGNLVRALAVSVLSHVLLLWTAFPLPRSADVAQPLNATLRAAAVPQLAAPPLPARAQGRREAPRAVASELPPRAVALSPAVAAPNTTPDSTAETPRRSAGAAAATAVAAATPAVAREPSDGIDAEGMRQYRLALAVEARRFKRYPARALESNLGGTVEIRVAVAAGGQPREIGLAHSSGHELLDDAALDTMRQAVPRAAVPERLRGRTFVVSLPVVFDLADP